MIKTFFDDLSAMELGDEPTASQLHAIGARMLALAKEVDWSRSNLPRATGAEELVYPLYIVAQRPSLYLVSDAAGVASPPHEHHTWAVIVGLSGEELNILYEREPDDARSVKPVRETAIKAMDVICLPNNAVHSTLAVGAVPTFHLHLYGRPLHELAPFGSRCFATGAA